MSEWDFLWDLKGQELYDAISTGCTYADLEYIDEMERSKKKIHKPEKKKKHNNSVKTLVFIDAENISCSNADKIDRITSEISKRKEVRYYAMQKDPATSGWKQTVNRNHFKPILMSGQREKNKIDNKIIRDVKKALANNEVNNFIIVSKDGDYKEITSMIKACGKKITVIAPDDASKKLKNAGSKFISLKK